MYGKKTSYTGVVGSQLQHPGSMGVQCLSQGHLGCDKEVNCQPSSCQPTNPFFELWVGIELPTLWLLDDHTHHCATANPNTNIKIYEKNPHTNVWKKRVQNVIQMYDKNTHTKSHTNVWRKHAYKFMKKTHKHAYKCMKKNTHTNVWQKRVQNHIQMYDKKTRTQSHTNVWEKHA